jgi:hypothetical protein
MCILQRHCCCFTLIPHHTPPHHTPPHHTPPHHIMPRSKGSPSTPSSQEKLRAARYHAQPSTPLSSNTSSLITDPHNNNNSSSSTRSTGNWIVRAIRPDDAPTRVLEKRSKQPLAILSATSIQIACAAPITPLQPLLVSNALSPAVCHHRSISILTSDVGVGQLVVTLTLSLSLTLTNDR